MPWNSNKLFGVIQRDCIATDVTGIDIDEIASEPLKRGTLIEIIPDFRGDGCYFKMCDFTNCLDKYKTTMYKCAKDDYIAVTKELWPYLLALKNESRVNVVQNVYSRKFVIDVFKLNRVVRIRTQRCAAINYYDFRVTHNGEVNEIGPGYYIGLQFKNGHVLLPPELEDLSRYYKFGGLGIVVTADWIMLNLYKEEDHKTGIQNVYSALLDISVQEFELTKNIFKSIRRSSSPVPVQVPKKIRRMSVMPKNSRLLPKTGHKLGYNLNQTKIIDSPELVKKNLLTSELTEPLEEINKISDVGAISKTQYDATCKKPNTQLIGNAAGSKKNAETTKCGLCAKIIEFGRVVILRECLHSFCKQCIRSHIEINSKYSYIWCPNKQVECQFDLLDIDIKDVVGDGVYNKIRNNRLKESDLGKKSNARPCPNANCNNIWISARKVHPNYERCSECKIAWCYICSNSHEPGELHGFRMSSSVNLKKRNKPVSKPHFGTCAKCCKSNIRLSKCITLQKCKHTFCNDCIVPMIKSKSTSELQYAQCIICQKQLEDVQYTKKTGFEMLKLVLDHRDNRSVTTSSDELCCCQPPVPNCYIILKCKHQFCRTRFNDILQKQFQSSSRATCPTCLEEIDDCQQKHLAKQMQSGIVKTCGTCSNLADIHLEICRHAFCNSCVRDLITNQVSDLSKMSINCNICHDPLTDSDISRYGSKEIFVLFKSKIEAATLVSKPVDYIKLTNWSFHCATCKQRITMKNEIKLAGCRDCFCLECCKKFIGRELSNSQIPGCPFCLKLPQQFEVDAKIGKNVDKPHDIKILVKCLKCENKFEESLIQTCSKCSKSICLKCAKSTILGQITNNRLPGCPFCQILLDESQIDSITNATFTLKQEPEINNNKLNSSHRVVEDSFNCGHCKKLADLASKIILINCKHEICSKCLCGDISDQLSLYLIPQCPFCGEQIDHIQLDSLGVSVIYSQATGFPKVTFSLKKKPEISYSKLMSSHLADAQIFCIVCDELIDHASRIVLINCKHELCLKCLREQISDQVILNLTLKCPICLENIDLNQLESLGISTNNQFSLEISFSKADESQMVRTIKGLNMPNSEEIPFKCIVCEESPEHDFQIVLVQCKHEICWPCLISNQKIWSRSPKCSKCKEDIDQIQLDELRMVKASRKTNSTIFEEPDTCSSCNEECRHKIILRNCAHKFCRQCVLTSVTVQAQQSNGNAARCPICSEPIEPNQITLLQMSSDLIVELNIYPFECPICNKHIDLECGIVLTNCRESLCRDCISYAILQQSAYSVEPNCPMCQTRITDGEVSAINSGIHEIFGGNRMGRTEVQLLRCLGSSLDASQMCYCVICEETFESPLTKILSFCKDQFCYQCITAALTDQIFINKIPSCPLCCSPVATLDIIELCGAKDFKRCVENKRNKLRLENF